MGYRKKPKASFRQGKIPVGPRVIKRFDGDHIVSEAVERLAEQTGKSLLELEKEGKIVQIRRFRQQHLGLQESVCAQRRKV